MKLWTYWRSSCSYRVRIALQLKGLPVDSVPVHLTLNGGEQHSDTYRKLHPQALVPAFRPSEGDGPVLTQSMAILEYLEERWPRPALLPATVFERARVRAFCQCIASDTQPLQNLRVLKMLASDFGLSEEQVTRWTQHHIKTGLQSAEQMVNDDTTFCFGEQPSLADVVLVPQLYNARRFGVDLTPYPRLRAIDAACRRLPTFEAAAPEAHKPCARPAARSSRPTALQLSTS